MKRVLTLNITQVSNIDHRPFNFLANIFFSISEAFFIIDFKLHSNIKDNAFAHITFNYHYYA